MFFDIPVMFVFVLLSGLGTVVSQEHVCLKSYDLGDKISLNCTVDQLQHIVTFKKPDGDDYGRCEAIEDTCSFPNMVQNKTSHTITVLMNKTDDVYGTWTCEHGKNVASDTITIKRPESSKDKMNKTHWKNVAIGVICILIISGLVNVAMTVRLCITWKQGKSTDVQESEELQPLIDKTDEDMSSICTTCTLASVCAICSDCEKMFCEICCNTHVRSSPEHRVCQIDHVVTCNFDVNCKICKEKSAENVCMTCVKEMCFACCKHHRVDEKKHVIKRLLLTKCREGKRKREDTEHVPNIKYKCKIKTKEGLHNQPQRICGLCFITDGRIVISEYHFKQIQIYRTDPQVSCIKYDLEKEPKGMTSINDNRIAITYPYERQIKLYKINGSAVDELETFQMKDKPFSITYSYPNFAVEIGEGDDGIILILNENGEKICKINNETSFAYFTSNTIRLALDSNNKKVFVAALSKKSISCIDFSGNILWRKPVPSPRGLVFLGNVASEKNMIIASKRWNLIFNMNSADGQNDIIMSSGRVKGPRYIDYNIDEKLLCIQVDDGDILVYNYDITKDI